MGEKKEMLMEEIWKSLKWLRPLYVNRSSNGTVQSLIVKVEHKPEKTVYALKIYPNHDSKTDPALSLDSNFLIDVSFMQKFRDHPNVVRLIHGETGQRLFCRLSDSFKSHLGDFFAKSKKKWSGLYQMGFILMEYTPRGSLSRFLKKHKKSLEVNKRLHFAHDILQGVACFHSQKYVIQDLKPSNLLVFGCTIKLCDFEDCASIEKMGWNYSRGTDGYIAPERIVHCLPLSLSADIWSLGVVLFKLFQCVNRQKKKNDQSGSQSSLRSQSLSSGDLEKQELIKCFTHYVDQSNLESTFSQWTQKYLPEMFFEKEVSIKGKKIHTQNQHICLSPQWVGVLGDRSRIVEQLIRSCLQVDPDNRPTIWEVQQMYSHIFVESPKMTSTLSSSSIFGSIANLNIVDLQGKETHDIDFMLESCCPELRIYSDLKRQQVQRVLCLAKKIICKSLIIQGIQGIQGILRAVMRTETYVSAALWIACHAYLDIQQILKQCKSLWISWYKKREKEVRFLLQTLEWNCF